MNNFTKGFSYLIAAQFQAIGLILAAWWIGDWLNKDYPIAISWYAITFSVGMIAVAHTFYIVIRQLMRSEDSKNKKRVEK